MNLSKDQKRKRIHLRIRKAINGSPERPRLNVFRSNKYISAQIIDDLAGHTLASASSREEAVPKNITKTEQARIVGKLLAERAAQLNVSGIVFDRSGYLYHGRVKALADGAREGGLNF